MSPQNGHMRCKAKSLSCGATRKNSLAVAARKAGRLRRRTSKACRPCFMAKTPAFLWLVPNPTRQVGIAEIRNSCQNLPRPMMTDSMPANLCRIAHRSLPSAEMLSEQFGSVIRLHMGDHHNGCKRLSLQLALLRRNIGGDDLQRK